MKVITPGKIPEPPKPFWHNMQNTCNHCNCVFEIEGRHDIISTGLDGKRVSVKCPTCNWLIYVHKPEQQQITPNREIHLSTPFAIDSNLMEQLFAGFLVK